MQTVVNRYGLGLYTSGMGDALNLATRGKKIRVHKPEQTYFLIIDFSTSTGKSLAAFQILY